MAFAPPTSTSYVDNMKLDMSSAVAQLQKSVDAMKDVTDSITQAIVAGMPSGSPITTDLQTQMNAVYADLQELVTYLTDQGKALK